MKKIIGLGIVFSLFLINNCFAAVNILNYNTLDSGLYRYENGKVEYWSGLEMEYNSPDNEVALLEIEYHDIHENIQQSSYPLTFLSGSHKIIIKKFLINASGNNNQLENWIMPSKVKIKNIHYLPKLEYQNLYIPYGTDFIY